MFSKTSFKDTFFHISMNSLGLSLSLSRMLVEFSLKLIYSTMCGKNFRIYDVHIPKKCIESTHFYSCLPLPAQNSPPSSCHYILGRKKYSFPRQIFFENLFPPRTERSWETFICFIKIESDNMNMTWNIALFIFCMICIFFKCDGFTVLQSIIW